MFLGGAVPAEALQDLTRHFIHFSIFLFRLEIIIRAVEVADGMVPLYDAAALLVEMSDVGVIVLGEEVHRAEDVLVSEGRLLIVMVQVIIGAELGVRVENPRVGEKTVDLIRIERDLPVLRDIAEEIIQVKLMIDGLQEEISDIGGRRGGSHRIRGNDLFVKVQFHLHGDSAVFLFLVCFRDLFLCIGEGIFYPLREQFGVLPDAGDIAGGCFLPVPVAHLDEVSGVFRFPVKVKFHSTIIS